MRCLQELLKSVHETSWQEWLAAVTGLISVILGIKNNIWNWFFQIVSSVFYVWVFWQAHLYSSMGLNLLYFLPMQFYGWWCWSKFGPQANNRLPITRASPALMAGCIVVASVFAAGWGWFAATHTQAFLPYLDAAVTGLSISAEFLDSRKKVENFHLWGVVNLVYAFILLPPQKYYVSAILYFIFLILAFVGAFEWTRLMKKQVASDLP